MSLGVHPKTRKIGTDDLVPFDKLRTCFDRLSTSGVARRHPLTLSPSKGEDTELIFEAG